MESQTGESRVDVAIIGTGIMGASAARELSRRGVSTLLLEQFDLGHERGSSHGNSRIFRLAYDAPDYVRLAQMARVGWQELEAETGLRLLEPGGAIDIGPPAELGPIESALIAAGSSVERTGGQNLTKETSGLRIPEGWEILFQPDGGTLAAGRAFKAFIDLARASGATILERSPVTEVASQGDSVTVRVGDRLCSAGIAVVTAAGWTDSLLRSVGARAPTRVTREHVAYYQREESSCAYPFIWHPDDGKPQLYGVPSLAEPTVKIGRHMAGQAVLPDSEATVDADQIELINQFVRRNTVDTNAEPLRAETCLYASTADDDFIIDRVGNIVIGAGFGGHGFKFAPIIGTLLADLVEGKPSDFAHRFRVDRFEEPVVDAS